jgi:hypothetical protein
MFLKTSSFLCSYFWELFNKLYNQLKVGVPMIKQLNLLLDLLFYFVLPILFWELGRVYLSDYVTILVSSFSGIIYSLYRFLQSSGINFTRVYLFVNVLIGMFIDLCSRTALQLLWNDVYYTLVLGMVFFISSFCWKPLFFYFALDILVLQGYDRKLTKEIFLTKEAMRTLRILNLLNGIKEFVLTVVLIDLLQTHGVEIYTLSVLLDQLIGFIVSGLSLIGYLHLYKLMNGIVIIKKIAVPPKKLILPQNWYHLHFENNYFFLRKHFF